MMFKIRKEKMIIGFKLLSILLLVYMMIDICRVLNNDDIVESRLEQYKMLVEPKSNENSKMNFLQKLINCENFQDQSINMTRFEVRGSTYVYCLFALALGGLLNAEKIVKIGII